MGERNGHSRDRSGFCHSAFGVLAGDNRPMTRPRIMIVGEAFGEDEERLGLPFVGKSGWMLNQLLEEAGIERHKCYVTNVFNLRPKPTNDIKNLCTDKSGDRAPMPDLARGLYLRAEYFSEVQRLWREVEDLRPNIIIALGGTATWALTGYGAIRKSRGTVGYSTTPQGFKVLPTYHPAAVLREWNLRPVVIADLMKALRQSEFPEVRRPKRELWIEPSLNHIELFYETYYRHTTEAAFDIETAGQRQITCVGFAPSPTLGIVIPFVDNRQPDGCYWRSATDERVAWEWVRRYLSHSALKIGQNTLYDINWLWSRVGITPVNYDADTMLMHHAMQPEAEKGLGFLGSIYTDEPAWKTMRSKGMFTTKRGE